MIWKREQDKLIWKLSMQLHIQANMVFKFQQEYKIALIFPFSFFFSSLFKQPLMTDEMLIVVAKK